MTKAQAKIAASFFAAHPRSGVVLLAGQNAFLEHYRGEAVENAKRQGVELEAVLRDQLPSDELTAKVLKDVAKAIVVSVEEPTLLTDPASIVIPKRIVAGTPGPVEEPVVPIIELTPAPAGVDEVDPKAATAPAEDNALKQVTKVTDANTVASPATTPSTDADTAPSDKATPSTAAPKPSPAAKPKTKRATKAKASAKTNS